MFKVIRDFYIRTFLWKVSPDSVHPDDISLFQSFYWARFLLEAIGLFVYLFIIFIFLAASQKFFLNGIASFEISKIFKTEIFSQQNAERWADYIFKAALCWYGLLFLHRQLCFLLSAVLVYTYNDVITIIVIRRSKFWREKILHYEIGKTVVPQFELRKTWTDLIGFTSTVIMHADGKSAILGNMPHYKKLLQRIKERRD